MAWSSSWGLTDLVSSVGETLKQYESVVDHAMGVPAPKPAAKREEEPDTSEVPAEAFAPDVDASLLTPRAPSPPRVQPSLPLPVSPQSSNGTSAIKSPAPTRPNKDEFSLEDLLGSPFPGSKPSSVPITPATAPAATPTFADPLRLFGLTSDLTPDVASPPVHSLSAPKDTSASLPSSTPQHTQPVAPSISPSPLVPIDQTSAPLPSILSPIPRAASPAPIASSLDLPAEPLATLEEQARAQAPSEAPPAVVPAPAVDHKAGDARDDEVRRLREILTQRERQLETLNAAGSALHDTNASLLAELEHEKLRHTDLDRISAEYGSKITDLERRLASATKERDQLRRDRDEQARGGDASAEELARARSEVAQLRAEGEALSRRQLALEEAAKKNRKKMKDDEGTLAALNERVKSMEQLLETKTERLKIAEENNRKYDESIGSLRSLNESLTKRLEEKTRAAEAAQAQLAETQAALEKTWRELAEQKRLGASAEERTETVSKETESKIREEARSVLAKQERDFAAKEADLHQAMLELRATIARNLERAAWREDELRKEVADLQQRLQEAQARTQELNALNAESTRPLLRQIDSLQQSHQAKQQIWDQLETSLTGRVHEAEERAQLAVDKERAAVTALNEVSIRVRSLESQLSSERGNSARLAAELDMARSSSDEQIKTIQSKLGQAEVQQREAESALREARSREVRLQQEMREVTAKAEVRVQALEKRVAEAAATVPVPNTSTAAGREPSGALSPSPSTGSLTATPLRRPSETSLVALGNNYGGGLAPALEKLQAMHAQREGEVASLQEQLSRVERERSALAEELVSLTTKVSQLQAELATAQALKAELGALKQRHTTALELLGEKEEKLEEAKADLADMKQMYRSQITEMVEKNAQLAQEVATLKSTPR